jgi:sigma-E factor negative regulatory protein RseB
MLRFTGGMLAGALLSLTSMSVFAGPLAQEPALWLEKMSNALRNKDYQGTFTYIRGRTFDTVRIVHRVVDGVEEERLFNLNGEVRELYRDDREILCFHPVEDTHEQISLDHTVQIGPFNPAFSERVIATQSLYRLAMHGEGRIAGRDAVILSISPINNDRYGYRVWLDQETGLLLQSHLVDRGSVKEIFQFTNLDIGASVTNADIASAIEGETVFHKLSLDVNELSEKPVWRVSWLPDGFRAVRVQGNRLHFSDGLATFSVFVEKAGGGLPDMTTTVGGTVVITRNLKNAGPQITVVGEVPVQTARRVAESVEPALY